MLIRNLQQLRLYSLKGAQYHEFGYSSLFLVNYRVTNIPLDRPKQKFSQECENGPIKYSPSIEQFEHSRQNFCPLNKGKLSIGAQQYTNKRDNTDKQTNRQMDKQTNGQIDKWTNRQIDKQTNGQMDKQTNGQIDK